MSSVVYFSHSHCKNTSKAWMSCVCRRLSLPPRGPSLHESWGQGQTTWSLSLPSIPTVLENLLLPSNEPVSENISQSQMDEKRLFRIYHREITIFPPHRVPARCLQSTSGPGRLLLSHRGLGSALHSCAGLQTHLWTKRSGTHSVFSLSVPLTWTVLCVLFTETET